MKTIFMLLAQYESPVVKLSDICSFFGLSENTANERASLNRLPIPTFRLEKSQKAPRMVHLQDLADFIDRQRKEATKQWERSQI
ncbi:pyocin activator PrtN family protein [Crenobacter luteus]|uniref:Pyocin activator protein PrtN n=1 Tax=Crenobacter luteus TaxID=1452487 RepID=A0A161SB60_9NEIS|nr:pyocin activator PrtN family protein [Crenobacter luteus]KZE25333.1 pyocin activator protein PrtN [Crenobacter luteus]